MESCQWLVYTHTHTTHPLTLTHTFTHTQTLTHSQGQAVIISAYDKQERLNLSPSKNEGQPINYLIAAPTMRIPTNVSKTANAYLAFRAVLRAGTVHKPGVNKAVYVRGAVLPFPIIPVHCIYKHYSSFIQSGSTIRRASTLLFKVYFVLVWGLLWVECHSHDVLIR